MRKDFEVEAFFCQFACILSHALCLFGVVGDVADSVCPTLHIAVFYGNADSFLVDVNFEIGVTRTNDGNAESKCFYECGEPYGIGKIQTTDDNTAFPCHQFGKLVGDYSVGVMYMDRVGQGETVNDVFYN